MTNDGSELERAAYQLLALKGVQNLSREKQLRSKKPDLYFETTAFGSRRRYAVECKDYSGTLTQSEISRIRSEYEGAFRDNEISDLLVITRGGIAPSAQSYVDAVPELSHLALQDLRNSIIDFRSYLSGLKERFLSDPAFCYYVPPEGSIEGIDGNSSTKEPKLLEAVKAGLDECRKPFAVLGAYGIGKTTLAKRLFLDLYEAWERDNSRPVPIYIGLHRMMREQTLEGLLGAVFTSVTPCTGYNFDVFCSLNAAGAFVLLLDGFDEMRHRLTWDEFLFNVDQLAILTAGNPRSVLLGRPTAFMSEAEYDAVIHATKPNGSITFHRPEQVSYRTIEIHELTTPQMFQFVESFCRWRYPNDDRLMKQALHLVGESSNKKLQDIARRPVQLMMLLEIFPQLPTKLDNVTHATVYSLFVDELIRREKAKESRRSFTREQHRAFGQRVAWWLWVRGGEARVAASQIGPEVLNDFIGPNDSLDVVRRELVTGSFLTTEGGTSLHFPHRSLQEYFVAEYLADLANKGELVSRLTEDRAVTANLFSSEVIDFVGPQLDPVGTTEIIALFDSMRIIPRNALDLVHASKNVRSTVQERLIRTGGVVCAWFSVYEVIRDKTGGTTSKAAALELMSTLKALFVNRRSAYARKSAALAPYSPSPGSTPELDEIWLDAASYLLCMLVVVGKEGNTTSVLLETLLELREFQMTSVIATESTTKGKSSKRRKVIGMAPQAAGLLTKLAENMYGDRLNVDWIYKFLRSQTRSAPFVSEWILGDSISVPGVKLPTQFSLSHEVALRELLEKTRWTSRYRQH